VGVHRSENQAFKPHGRGCSGVGCFLCNPAASQDSKATCEVSRVGQCLFHLPTLRKISSRSCHLPLLLLHTLNLLVTLTPNHNSYNWAQLLPQDVEPDHLEDH
jgi:hypothetical protein